jgi:hypothetical protein
VGNTAGGEAVLGHDTTRLVSKLPAYAIVSDSETLIGAMVRHFLDADYD